MAEKTRAALARLSAVRSTLAGVVFIAIDPPTDWFAVGQAYDLRFGADGLQIARSGSQEATAEYRYAELAAVQVTGFERDLTVSKMELLFAGSLALMHDDAKEYRTHLRVQTVDQILDFWHVALSSETFGRWLEPVKRDPGNLALGRR